MVTLDPENEPNNVTFAMTTKNATKKTTKTKASAKQAAAKKPGWKTEGTHLE